MIRMIWRLTVSGTSSSKSAKEQQALTKTGGGGSAIGVGRVLFTLALLAVIALIFVYDIQFSDIRDLWKLVKKKYDL